MEKENPYPSMDIRRIVLTLQEKTTYRQDMPGGYMDMTVYPVMPGICLVLNDVHTQAVPLPSAQSWPGGPFFVVNFCLGGRCEFRLGHDSYSYVDTGLSSIGTQMAQDGFYYPSSYYLGFEIYAFPELLPQPVREQLAAFCIDFDLLLRRYARAVCSATPEPLAALWRNLYGVCQSCDPGYIRLTVLQVLHYLCSHEALSDRSGFFLTRTQSALAKRACAMLTEDLSRHMPVREIAAALGVSETSLKTYFRTVYGVNISEYAMQARMRRAAELLTGTRQSIADISKACGYVNQGRFAKLFRDCYGMKPLDYRRSRPADSPAEAQK